IVWAVLNSVAPNSATSQTDGVGFGNYAALLDYGAGLWAYLGNPVVVTAVAVGTALVVATTGGYGFARFAFPGKNLLFTLVLSVLMVPYAALLVPLAVWLNEIGLQNSLVAVG